MQMAHGTYISTPSAVVVQRPNRRETFARRGDVLMSGSGQGEHATYRRAPE
jgi:hypothetical protein